MQFLTSLSSSFSLVPPPVYFLPVSKASADCDDSEQKSPVAASSAVDNCVDYTLMPQDTWFHKLIVKKVNSFSCFVDVIIEIALPFQKFWGFLALTVYLFLF